MELPGPRLRALVADPSVVMRRFVLEALSLEGGVEVVAVAGDEAALAHAAVQARPDVVVLAADLPGRAIGEQVRELRRAHPRLPIILLTIDSTAGAAATLDALAAGANDYVARPPGPVDRADAVLRLATDLGPKLRALCRVAPAAVDPLRPRAAVAASAGRALVRLICVGVSTGGPNALADLFSGFTRPLPVPMLIVQHMPAEFTGMLAQRLARCTPVLGCREAVDGELAEPGCALLAPGGRHLGVRRRPDGALLARLSDGPPENACRPAADVLFREAVEAVGGGVLAVVMTGMGNDGRAGAQAIRAAGGQVIVQDETTSVVWGMPRVVAEAGLADAVLPLGQLAGEILRRACVGRA